MIKRVVNDSNDPSIKFAPIVKSIYPLIKALGGILRLVYF